MGSSFTQICYQCFRQRRLPDGPCEHCGFDPATATIPQGALRPGHILQGRYLVGLWKKSDPRYFDYTGMDLRTNAVLLIREYFNPMLMGRQADGVNIGYYASGAQLFLQEREQFARWAGQIAQNDGKYSAFKENHTWYLVQQTGRLISPVPYGNSGFPGADLLSHEGRDKSPDGLQDSANGHPQSWTVSEADTTASGKRKKSRGWIAAVAACGSILAVLLVVLLVRIVLPQIRDGYEDEGGNSGSSGSQTVSRDERDSSGSSGSQTVSGDEGGDSSDSSGSQTVSGDDSGDNSTASGSQEEYRFESKQVNASFADTGKNYDPGTTVMIYLIGSNLESEGAEASLDLDELLDAQIDTDRNHILIYTGGTRYWHQDIPADRNCLYALEDHIFNLQHTDDPVQNMGEADTLAGFINYCTDKYPSDHYQLILWDHGGGPVYGFGVDDNYQEDTLENQEIREAMDQTIFAAQPLDLIAYNACIMGTVETAALWADYADYLLADGEVEYSWDFHFMEILNETSDPVKMAAAIAESYHAQYRESIGASDPPLALNCISLGDFDRINTCLENLGRDLKEGMAAGDFAKIAAARTTCFQYGYLNSASKENAYDLVDLGDLCANLYALYPESAAALFEAMEENIVYRESGIPEKMGVSVYFPYDCDYLYLLWTGLPGFMESINPSASWCEFTRDFADRHFSESSSSDWKLEPSVSELPSLTLSSEQAEETAAIYAAILEDFGNGTYGTVMQNIPVGVSDDGEAVLEEIPDIFCLVTSEDEIATAIPSVLMQKAGEIEYYCTESIDPDGIVRMLLGISDDALHAMFLRNAATEELEMLGFAADVAEDHSIVNTRNEVSLAGIDAISYTLRALMPGHNDRGEMLPCRQWEETSGGESRTLQIDYLSEDPELPMPKKLTLSETGKSYVCQFIAEDIYGEEHGSELVKII